MLAFVCNVCDVNACICVYSLIGRGQRGAARGGQTQQVQGKGGGFALASRWYMHVCIGIQMTHV